MAYDVRELRLVKPLSSGDLATVEAPKPPEKPRKKKPRKLVDGGPTAAHVNALLDKDAELTCQQQNPKRGESALRYDKYKAATSAKLATDASVAAALVDRLEPLLKLLDDDDLDCKKKALGLVHAAAHNRLSLLEAHSGFVESRLATLAALKIEHVVDLGPFKHKVDDGLPLRKAALAALATLVDRKAVTDTAGCVDVVAGALADKNADVQAQAHQLLVKLCALDAASVLAKADAICEPLDKAVHKKIKEGTAKDDRAWDLVRSALRAVLAVKELPGGCPRADALLEKARAKDKLAAELAALAK